MFYRLFAPPDADSHRATVIALALAARGRRGVSQELREAERAVREPGMFPESALRIGLLLGFDATAPGSEVRWTTRGDRDTVSVSLVFAGPSENLPGELSRAAARLRELLDELGWRTILPRYVVSLAIERGFERYDLQLARLKERLNADAL
jgi:hypothetical protein